MTQIPTPELLEYIAWLELNSMIRGISIRPNNPKHLGYFGRIRHAGSGRFYLLEKECTTIGCGCSEGEEEE